MSDRTQTCARVANQEELKQVFQDPGSRHDLRLAPLTNSAKPNGGLPGHSRIVHFSRMTSSLLSRLTHWYSYFLFRFFWEPHKHSIQPHTDPDPTIEQPHGRETGHKPHRKLQRQGLNMTFLQTPPRNADNIAN